MGTTLVPKSRQKGSGSCFEMGLNVCIPIHLLRLHTSGAASFHVQIQTSKNIASLNASKSLTIEKRNVIRQDNLPREHLFLSTQIHLFKDIAKVISASYPNTNKHQSISLTTYW